MSLGWWLTSYEKLFCGDLGRRPPLETTSVQDNRWRSSWEEGWTSSPAQSRHVLTLFPTNVFISSRSFNDPPRGTSVVVQWLRIHLPLQGRGHTFDPLSGKMPHASWQLRPRVTAEGLGAATTESHVLRTRVWQQKKPPQGKAHKPQLESSPNSLQLEKKACTVSKIQHNTTTTKKW